MELLLNMTIGGTATACLILLVKQLLKNQLTPKWHFYIWIILAVRLLIPGLPESEFSLMNTVPTTHNITAVQNEAAASADPSAENLSGYVQGKIVSKSPITGIEQKREFSVPEHRVDLILAIWFAGSVLMAGYLIGSYLLFSRRVKKLPKYRDPEVLELLNDCRFEAGIVSGRISLRSGGNTPMLHGIIHPSILIPEGYTREELRHVLIHELCHYKHKDILINVICSAFLCIYWFNPVLWLCFYTIRRDIEFLCDERVIDITGERREYSRTLLKTALKRNQFLFATTSMQNGEKEVSKRIRHIAYFRKPKLWISAIAVLIVLAAGAVCLTDASSLNTVNVEIGGGYFMKIPESWIENSSEELRFTDEKGINFGGASYFQGDPVSGSAIDFESAELPLPKGSKVLERKEIKGDDTALILINLDLDTKNRNYIFLPGKTKGEVYSIWADSSKVTERQLIKIAETLRENPYPQGYQPETAFQDDWTKTADRLLNDYFRNYVDADMSMSSDISGYRIDAIEPYEDPEASWSVIYPDAAVFRVDYTLDIAYPDRYFFPGGGFEVGLDHKTKIYKDQLAVFIKDHQGNATFRGFVWPQDLGEMGEAGSILHTISYTDPAQSPEALLKLKIPYIGDNSHVWGILGNLPLAQYSTGLELHTKAEPYGLTVNYDLTALGDKVFRSRPDKAKTDSSGWDPNPHLNAQLYKNSMILLSLIDNCSTVEFRITGMSENGVPYTYYYLRDREASSKELSRDPRTYTESMESFTEFINQISQ